MSAPAPEGAAKSSPPAPAAPTSAPGSVPASAAAAASSSFSSSMLLKPVKPFTALVLGASGATGRVLVSKLANKSVEQGEDERAPEHASKECWRCGSAMVVN